MMCVHDMHLQDGGGPNPDFVIGGVSALHEALAQLLVEARRAGIPEARLQSCLAPVWRFARETGAAEVPSVGGSS